ncbi:MAG: DUF2155 domain-containing protein [Xanthobacteraceae bacterium]|nr:DUF2155 domain-containing protein [Xanthobacteraceae bacterium]
MFRTTSLVSLAAIAAALWVAPAPPAAAQLGNIFSDPAPRPPGNVPQGGFPSDDDEEDVPDLPRGRLLPTPIRPPLPPGQAVPPPGRVQSQPLQPPPGSAAAPPSHPGVAVAPPNATGNAPAGQKPRTGTAAAPPPAATLQPGDEVVTEPPAQKIVNKKATFSGLDKITGRIISFDADIGETVQFGALRVKTDACYTRPATEAANTDAFVEVDEITLQGEVKRIFSGWMFAASPGLHGVEHPIYDIWLTDCKGPETTVVAGQADAARPETAAKPAPTQQRRQPREQRRRPPPPPPPTLPPFQR